MPAQFSTAAPERRVFGARMRNLPETAAFVDDFCARHGIGRDDALRLALIIEELFANTVAHGYRQEGDAPIAIALARGDGMVAVAYEDAAPQFDPSAQPPADISAPVESRPIGGLGLHLVRKFARNIRYAREDGRNRVWLSVPCASLAHGKRAIAQP
jgi:anti-sigma regulatory factor (Ser/Thr protein kinase)